MASSQQETKDNNNISDIKDNQDINTDGNESIHDSVHVNDEDKSNDDDLDCTDTVDDVLNVKWIDKGNYMLIPSTLDPNDKDVLTIVCISDTHSIHKQIRNIPKGDILIHAGDFTNCGELSNCQSYDKWVKGLLQGNKFKKCVLIAGNHDITMNSEYYENIGYPRFHRNRKQDYKECQKVAKQHSIYLEDNGTQILNLNIYGTPWQPEFCDWAFMLKTEKELNNKWKLMDQFEYINELDILICHTPPYLHGDRTTNKFITKDNPNEYIYVGSRTLLNKIKEIKPKFVVFGHIHGGYSVSKHKGLDTIFINAATLDSKYKCVHKPVMFYIKRKSNIKTTKIKD